MEIDEDLVVDMGDYLSYMYSKEWRALREERLEIDEHKCVLCKSEDDLVCHHLTYRNMYKESIFELITLCSGCHWRIHKLCPPKDQPYQTKLKAQSEMRLRMSIEQKKATVDEVFS